MNRAESAAVNIAQGKMNCSQSVLTAFSEELGLDRDKAIKLAIGFGAGMGRTGKTCGSVTGAYMVIGLRFPYQKDKPQENKERIYRLIQEFDKKFIQANGSTLCTELLGCDLSTSEGSALAKEKGLFTSICPKYVKSAVEILEQMEFERQP